MKSFSLGECVLWVSNQVFRLAREHQDKESSIILPQQGQESHFWGQGNFENN